MLAWDSLSVLVLWPCALAVQPTFSTALLFSTPRQVPPSPIISIHCFFASLVRVKRRNGWSQANPTPPRDKKCRTALPRRAVQPEPSHDCAMRDFPNRHPASLITGMSREGKYSDPRLSGYIGMDTTRPIRRRRNRGKFSVPMLTQYDHVLIILHISIHVASVLGFNSDYKISRGHRCPSVRFSGSAGGLVDLVDVELASDWVRPDRKPRQRNTLHFLPAFLNTLSVLNN